MKVWLIILTVVYLAILAGVTLLSRRRIRNTKDFIFAGSNIGAILGFLTFTATLFSTFTLQGMPDFFRSHGVGAWTFLAFSDGAMLFLILWFGYHLRKKASEKGFQGVAGLMADCYNTKMAAWIYFIGVFLFLIPYISIQVRGLAIFLNATFPDFLPAWGWSVLIVAIMLLYSEIGGLKAIMYADALQGVLLLTVVWIIAISCIHSMGGVRTMFRTIEQVQPELLSVPGPNGLFTFQFLLASFLAILFIPVTQPQLTTRLVVMKSIRSMHRMVTAVSIFVILIIGATVFIGMYGAVHYAHATTAEFLSNVLLFEQPGFIAALAVIGLAAAALSTSDSQIFALGSEYRSLLREKRKKKLVHTRVAMILLGSAATVMSVLSSDELVLLARVSFAGTALLAPMVLSAVLTRKQLPKGLLFITAAVLMIFLLSLFQVIPDHAGPFRMDLLLLLITGICSLLTVLFRSQVKRYSKT